MQNAGRAQTLRISPKIFGAYPLPAVRATVSSNQGRNRPMTATKPIIHFVGSIPLPDSETVFRTLSQSAGAHLARLPDGETGIRKSWIRFLQDVLAEHPAIEMAKDVPPFLFKQWDGKVVREIPRLRVKPGVTTIDPKGFVTGYA